jgi:hypothetical protein
MPARGKGAQMKNFADRVWDSIKVVFELLVSYSQSFEHNPAGQTVSEHYRDLAKTILEFIRNIAVVSAIKFFATRADSWVLNLFAEFGMFLIAVTVAAPLTQYQFMGWKTLNESKWRPFVIPLFTSIPLILVYFVLGSFINYVVKEIVRSQLLH